MPSDGPKSAGTGSRLAHLSLWLLTLFALFEPLGLRAAESYAPARMWAVDNWYVSDPLLNHKRSFPDAESSFTADWDRYEKGCSAGVLYSQLYRSWYYYPVQNSSPYLANAYFQYLDCKKNILDGPAYVYRSSSIRHWACADGKWRDPEGDAKEICSRQTDEPEPDKNKGTSCCAFGDPIDAGTGNKFETVVEFRGAGAHPLEFAWTYNSTGASNAGNDIGDMLGAMRSTTFSRWLSFSGTGDLETAYVSRPDGSAARFRKQDGAWIATGSDGQTLGRDSGTGLWVFEDSSGRDYFDETGRLHSYGDLTGGHRIFVQYDSLKRIRAAVDESGRVLTFRYGQDGRLESIVPPDGHAIAFRYSASGYLSEVSYANGERVGYLYDEAGYAARGGAFGALTGVIQADGGRFSSTYYDAAGRATSTKLAGNVDVESATYTLDARQQYAARAAITTASGAVRNVTFEVKQGRVSPVRVTRTCSGCVASTTEYSYGTEGRASSISRDGVVERRTYDSRGQITLLVEAEGTSQQRRTETDWHLDFRLPLERRVYDASGTLTTKRRWAYNSRGQMIDETSSDPVTGELRTRVTRYCETADVEAGRCPNVGLVLFTDGTRVDASDVTAYEYYGADASECATSSVSCAWRKGDLWKVVNAKGQVTETLAYDGAGRALSIKDTNGVITDISYDLRGRMVARTVRASN